MSLNYYINEYENNAKEMKKMEHRYKCIHHTWDFSNKRNVDEMQRLLTELKILSEKQRYFKEMIETLKSKYL